MWVIDSNGDAYNLAHACSVYTLANDDGVEVRATFPINTFDNKLTTRITLKTFDNVNDAKEFVGDIVSKPQAVDKNKLGYSFSWLKKVEALPDEQRAEFEGKVNDWLDDVSKPQAVKNENVPTSGDNPYLIDGIAL